MRWHEGPLLAFDLETTAPEPDEARIVQYAAAHVGGGPARTVEQVVDPGVDIPEESVKIHGISTEQARAEGIPAAEAVGWLVSALGRSLGQGTPLVGHNISYDLTVLDRECRRHLGRGLEDALSRRAAPVLDTMVLSKHVDKYRRRVSKDQGAHVLKTCVQVLIPPQWGITWDDEQAHGALYDCLMSARVAVAIGQGYPQVGGMDAAALHEAQTGWRAEQAASLESYLRSPKAGADQNPEAVVARGWPIVPAPGGEATGDQ